MRLRAAPARAQLVGTRALRRIPVRLHVLQAPAGVLREAAHLLRLLFHLPHRDPARAGRLVQPHAGRGHGPHLEPVPGGVPGALRAGGRVLPHRAPHLPPHGNAAATLVARVCPEREAALARPARGALSPFGGGGGVLGRHARRGGVPGRPAGARAAARQPLGATRLRDRRSRRARSRARRRRRPEGDRPGPGKLPRVLRAAHRQRGLLPARRVRRAAGRALAAPLREGTLTVTAGLPGTGIGGIFYLASALAMPLRAAYERLRGRPAGEWRVVRAQVAIAGGILGGMWGTGWLLGVAFAAAHRVIAPGAALPASNVFRTASLALALGTLAGVLVGVELLRLWVHRGREREPLDREASLSRHKPVARREPSVVPGWRLVTLLLLVESAAAADPRIAMAQYPGAVAARLACADSAWAAGNMDVATREYSA